MTIVGTFHNMEEAHLLRMRLEAEGVPAWLVNEHTIQNDWLLSYAIGGIRVAIAEEDLEAAREIMERDEPALALDEHGEILPGQEAPSLQNDCPKCGSSDVRPGFLGRFLVFFPILLMGFPLPGLANQVHCRKCGHDWTPHFRTPKEATN